MTTQTMTGKTMAMTLNAPRPTRTPSQSLAASAWPATSPAALRQRIAEQGTARTREEILDRALLRAIRREG